VGPRVVQIPRGPGGRSYARRRVDMRDLLDGRVVILVDGTSSPAPPPPPAHLPSRRAAGRRPPAPPRAAQSGPSRLGPCAAR
jgi:hypothetical protein